MNRISYYIMSLGIKIMGKFFGYVSLYIPNDEVRAIHFALDKEDFYKSIRDIATADTIEQKNDLNP